MKQQKYTNLTLVCTSAFIAMAAFCQASPAAEAEIKIEVPKKYKADASDLEIWNGASFKRQLAESYAAETEIEPRVTENERKELLKIMELITADEIDKAVAMLEKELGRNEAITAVFDFTLANIYFQADELDKAAGLYVSAVEKFAKFRRAWKNLGLIYIRQNNFSNALSPLTKVVELGGGDAITYGLLGYAYSSVDNNLAAESAYRMAVLLDPVTMDWKMGLARSFFKQERFAEAVALCGNLIKENPERADLWMLQANAYIGMGKAMKAAEMFELVDRFGKSTPETLNTLGDIYVNNELYDLAGEAYIKALDKAAADGNAERIIRSAKVLIARGAFTQTRRLITEIERRYSTQMSVEEKKDILKLRARLAVADGSNEEEEVQILRKIVELDPLDGEALILLGQHASRTGDMEKAVLYYERAENLEKFEADAKVRHAQLLVRQGKYAEALVLLRRAQQINPRENIREYLEQVEKVSK
ncbi:MAG: tetratricopeptide repeat protein [Phycisphaerae bacterium]